MRESKLKGVAVAFSMLLTAVGCGRTEIEFSPSAAAVGPRGSGSASPSSSGKPGATSNGSGTGNRSSGSTGTSTSGSSGTGSNVATSGSTSTGHTVLPTLTPVALFDAGAGEVFGPVSIASGLTGPGSSGAWLAYAAGDGGRWGIWLGQFSDQGAALDEPSLVTITNPNLFGPPHSTLTSSVICWEDSQSSNNVFGGCSSPTGPVVLCASLSDAGASLPASYSSCGNAPQLVYNPADRLTNLFFNGGEWIYGLEPGFSIAGFQSTTGVYATAPLARNLDGVFLASANNPYPAFGNGNGLLLTRNTYSVAIGYIALSPYYLNIDPTFDPDGLFAVGSDQGAGLDGILELNAAGPRGVIWGLDAGIIATTPIQSIDPPVGPVAAGACPDGFGYFAMTDAGSLLFAQQALDGTVPDSGISFALQDFASSAFVTSIAVAPNLEGDLLLAVSSTGQIGLYVVHCQ